MGSAGVPENLLAIQKILYHFMSRYVDPKVLKEAEEAMRPEQKKISEASFCKYINELEDYAKKHVDKKILLITLGASHGFLT